MIKIMDRNDDIFSSNAEVLVNPVNVVGVMGAGLAKQFKRRYPKMYDTYVQQCAEKKLSVGKIYVWEDTADNPKYIVCFPTKHIGSIHQRQKLL